MDKLFIPLIVGTNRKARQSIHVGNWLVGEMQKREEIETRTGRTISAGAVYTTLERLEARGFVSSWFGDPTPARGGRRKRHFRVEPDGQRALRRAYDGLQRMAHGVVVKLESSR